jgi:hypothetical protein
MYLVGPILEGLLPPERAPAYRALCGLATVAVVVLVPLGTCIVAAIGAWQNRTRRHFHSACPSIVIHVDQVQQRESTNETDPG